MFWVLGFILVFVALMIPTLAVILNSDVVKSYFAGAESIKLGEVIERIRAIEDEMSMMAGEIEALKDETKFVQRLLDGPERAQSQMLPPPSEIPEESPSER